MSALKPFRGLRPKKELVLKVAAPPYDVVNREEARKYAEGNAHSFFHVSRPEIDLPASVDEHADEVYTLGLKNLQAFIAQGILTRDDAAAFYVYRQKMGSHVQVGLVAGASVEEYDKGLIKKHELTRADKEDDRTLHVATLGANDEPVFLTYRADKKIDALIAEVTATEPEYDFTTDDGIVHTFWVAPPALTAKLEEAFRVVPVLYIADGHHRSAAASRVRKQYRADNRKAPHADAFLAVVFPHDQMQILDYNRVVKDLNGLEVETFVQKLRESFDVATAPEKKPLGLHQFGMYHCLPRRT